MRHFLDNLLRLQPQNLTLEALWLGWILYAVLALACLQDIWFSKKSWMKRTIWTLVISMPFMGIFFYAFFSLVTADSSFKELLRSRQDVDAS